MNKKKLTLCSILLTLAISTGVALGVATYAGFSAKALVEPSIGSKGSNDSIKTIYFNANLWDVDDPIIYMKRYNSSDGTKLEWIPVSKEIAPTVSGKELHLYCFQYDTSLKLTVNETDYALNTFVFVRCNPNGANLPSNPNTDLPAAAWAGTDNPKTVWNQSKAITFDSYYNYYVIKEWNQELGNSCMKNTLTYNTGSSQWQWSGNPDVNA